MKKEVHPGVVAGVVALALLGAVAYFYYGSGGAFPKEGDSKSMPMPKAAADFMAKWAEEQKQAGKKPTVGVQKGAASQKP